MRAARICITIALAAPLGGCIVPDAPFQGTAASPSAAPVPYTIDPLTGARLTLAAPPAEPAAPIDPAVADAEVAAFAAHHPLFDMVRDDMAQLMRQARASDLQHAYDQAVAARAARYRAEAKSKGPGL